MLTRRQFLKISVVAGASLFVPYSLLANTKTAYAFSNTAALKKFVQPLRGVGGSGIPVAVPDKTVQSWWQPGVTHYTIDIGTFEDQLHPDLPNPTRLWGYGQNNNFKHLGGIIAAKRGEPVQITFRNNLPPDHILPVDSTIMGVMGNQMNRTDVHLHGGLTPWVSDGGPYAWWDPNGHHGESFVNVLNTNLAANEAEYYYPNDQGSRFMWYHDHVIGLTRLNAYAGLASAYIIYDDYETSLVQKNNLPGPLDPRTIYLAFQEKIFVSNTTDQQDPTWAKIMPNSRPGDLWYAHVYDTKRWELSDHPAGLPPDPSCIPEYFGDTPLVNGTAYPYLEVEQRQYRFRMINATQARFLNPRLVYAKGNTFPDNAEANPNRPGPGFVQFGTEGGFLPYPVLVNGPAQPTLLLAPAERADLIVDFRNVPAGTTLILYTDAPGPYPMGDPVNDYTGTPGYGPNSHTLMQIRVKARSGAADPSINLPWILHPTDPFLIQRNPGLPGVVPSGVPVRRLTLNEDFDRYGRLIQRLGTDKEDSTGTFGRGYDETPTETVQHGATEIWEIVNTTGDTHPMHFHLVNVQLVSRQRFDSEDYKGGLPTYTGGARGPATNELGWKETVRCNPDEVTRLIMRFDLPKVPFTVPVSPRTGGNEYVWHCHILEHEEHDMMRPLVVT
ncbi:MAG TPA: multicopper oxidase domain-containing protein [Anaerolineaceae bacterium]|nr:multicopper oxidase domain-containing protein [Anaerolineaceae bacterium]